MICPKCEGRMQPVMHDGVEIDRCGDCGGLWFDAMEDRALRHREGAGAIDTGEAGIGRLHDAEPTVHCPRDQTQMARMVDLEQPHVWIESCPTCFGVFLDAGEFTDLREYTMVERWLRPKRPRLN